MKARWYSSQHWPVSVCRRLLYRAQNTPPKASKSIPLSDSVVITDPRHALYGRRVRLCETYESPFRDAWCVVELEPGLRTQISLAVTDRGVGAVDMLPLPLSWDSVQHLLANFAAVMDSPAEGIDNEDQDDRVKDDPAPGGDKHNSHARSSLEKPDHITTEPGAPKACADLPTIAATGKRS